MFNDTVHPLLRKEANKSEDVIINSLFVTFNSRHSELKTCLKKIQNQALNFHNQKEIIQRNPFYFEQNGYWKSLTVWQFLWNAFRSLRGAFEPVSVSFQEIHNCLLWDFGNCKMIWCQKTFRVIDQFWGKLSQSCLTFNSF